MCATTIAGALVATAAPAHAAVSTSVSLTFDDALASQSVVPSMLEAHGMRGTFYVNSGVVGTAGHLGWGQVASIAAAGHEIAGHTVEHVNLTTVDATTATYQVCEDRARLLNRGFAVRDFGYPFGEGYKSQTIRSIVQQCGYNTARRSWGLVGERCVGCTPYSETIPPQDLWGTKTDDSVINTNTLDTLKTFVTQAEDHGGGWVTLVIHDVCESCGTYAVSPSILQAFLDWLQPRAASGTVVKTVTQVIGGSLKASPGTLDTAAPSSSVTCNGGPCVSWYANAVQVALSTTDAGGSGFEAIRYTTDGTTPTLTSAVYSAPLSVAATTTLKYRAWDNAGNAEPTKTQVIGVDTTAPVSSITCNGAACSSGYYTSSVLVALGASDGTGSGVDVIRYTTDGTVPTQSSPVYSSPFTVGATTTVKFAAADVAGNVESAQSTLVAVDSTVPSSSIQCDATSCAPGWYTGAVQVSLAATDGGSGVDAIRYTTDGSDPTVASPAYTAPFSVAATTTVKFRAWDLAGNAEATRSQLIQVDSTAPSTAITCNAAACSAGAYTSAVQVALSATDGGSGLDAIRYTTDGSTPTLASPQYAGPFTVEATTTVKFRAWDVAGNGSPVATQVITIDNSLPASAIACDGAACSPGWYAAGVQISMSASDPDGGATTIRYTTDGSDPSLSSTVYTSPFTLNATTTVKFRAWDESGNAEPTNTQVVQVDTTLPTAAATCDGSPCSAGWYAAAVQFAVTAGDTGSGVASVHYSLDGSDPSLASPTYDGPFSVGTTTTVKYRAFDVAGNAGAIGSSLVRIDGDAPVSSITCNGDACPSGWFNAPVTVALAATDGSGSGVASIRYTTNGADPTASSTLYTGPFSVTSSKTVKFRAFDVAGNSEAVRSQVVNIDTAAPVSNATCNATGCLTSWYKTTVQVALSASDGTGSGVATIRYTLDGTDPTANSPVYSTPLVVSTPTTVKFRAWDVAGNAELTKTRVVNVDTAPPAGSITSPAAGASVRASVTVSATASDGESGVKSVTFYVDGTPIGTDATSPYAINWNTKKVSKGAHTLWIVVTDVAGNTFTSPSRSVTVT